MYIGIDPSLRSTGVCLIGDRGNYLRSWQLTTKNGSNSLPQDIGSIRRQLNNVAAYLANGIDFANVECVAIEVPFVGNNKLTAHILSAVWGAIVGEVAFNWNPKNIVSVHPGVLKKFTCGVVNADKARMKTFTENLWHFTHDCPDIIDAFALAQMARCCDFPLEFTRTQADIINDFLRLRNAAAGAEDA